MKCNSNCGCMPPYNNTNSNNDFNGSFNGNGSFPYPNCRPASIAAYTATNTTTTPAATTDAPANLTLNTIVFSSSSISAKSGSSKIFITQPGLYQASYFIVGENTGSDAATFTAFFSENSSTLASQTSSSVDASGFAILSASDFFYVSCDDLPATLSLAVTTTSSDFIFNYYVTINKICPENVNPELTAPGFIYGFPCCGNPFIGCENYAVPYNTMNNNACFNNQWGSENTLRCNRHNNGCNGCRCRCNNGCNC